MFFHDRLVLKVTSRCQFDYQEVFGKRDIMKFKLLISLIVITPLIFAENYSTESYTPNYIYGSQPLGTYIGSIDDGSYHGLFIPNGGPTQYYYPQSGLPQEMSQYLQGQEQLMLSKAQEEQQKRLREKQIQDRLLSQYQQQIHNQ